MPDPAPDPFLKAELSPPPKLVVEPTIEAATSFPNRVPTTFPNAVPTVLREPSPTPDPPVAPDKVGLNPAAKAPLPVESIAPENSEQDPTAALSSRDTRLLPIDYPVVPPASQLIIHG